MEYTIFSDESYISAERYRSIGAFSFPRSYENKINNGLESILLGSNVKEFKWKKLRDARYRFCAEKLINYFIDNVYCNKFRVDIIVWDTQDSRHKIIGRNDTANFGRMFFHLLSNLMKRKKKEANWYVYPDEKLGIDWGTIEECLKNVGKWKKYFKEDMFNEAFSQQYYSIREFRQVDSEKEPCCQIADFFAGIAVFSKVS